MRLLRRKYLITCGIVLSATPIIAYQHLRDSNDIKNLPAGHNILWHDPGDVASLDFETGIGGKENMPAPPFLFLEEDMSGTQPKVKVQDVKGRMWSVKFGPEVKSTVFATRLVWACGYFVETDYLVPQGEISGVTRLKRAGPYIQAGHFTDGRFELRSDSPKFLPGFNWTWASNPFLHTRELNGLKILMMLLSNWDAKDARDLDRSSNTATADSNLGIFEQDTPEGPEYLYAVTDWGASLGRWGSSPLRNKWECTDYAAQTARFVLGQDSGWIKFGFLGKHSSNLRDGISIYDAQWLLQYLGKVTDDQLRTGLAASGASPDLLECYLKAVRQRINELRDVAGTPQYPIPPGPNQQAAGVGNPK